MLQKREKMFEIIIVNGLLGAGIYALLGIGFTLIFGVARMLNFSHTSFYMLAAFFMYTGLRILHLPMLIAAAMSIAIPPLIAMVYYWLTIDRVKEHAEAVVILTVAAALLIQELTLFFYGGEFLSIPAFLKGYSDIAGVRVTNQQLFSFIICIITISATTILLSRSTWGYAIRAVSQDREIASLMGIDVSRVSLLTMGLSVTLAGIAGIVVAPIYSVEPFMWTQPLIIILAAVILGGLGSIKGSIIGAVILAFVEVCVVVFVPSGSYLKGVASLSVMVIVMLFKPEGLFGVIFEEERL
jgi:branched-chain amino acid transport system permease protein